MKGKHRVFIDATGDQPRKWYNGPSTDLRGNWRLENWSNDLSDATFLTQQQTKRLIDSTRGKGLHTQADPSFTVVY